MDTVEKLYHNYDILAGAGDKITEHEKEYLEILEAVKGSNNEKRLASQFIARFFKHFPHLADKAIDAQLDLCEDEDVAIRKQAIKDLPSFCKDTKEYVLKISDVLAQMLQSEDNSELSIVHSSFMTLFKLDAKGTLGGLFSQIINGEEVVRERAIRFLSLKVKNLPSEVLTKEVEEYLLQESRKVMQDVTGEEFITFINLLSGLKISKAIAGQQTLVDIITEQADLDKEFDYTDLDNIDRLIQCIKQAMPYISPYVSSGRFVTYICMHVFPVLDKLKEAQEGVDLALEMLKLLAELSPNVVSLEDDRVCLQAIFNKLLEYMPLPPSEENIENAFPEEPSLQLSHVECLMFSFHQLAKKSPDFLTGEGSIERLRDFKLRLQFLARCIQGYIKKLREALQGKKGEELKTEENKLKMIALKTTTNINTLIRDLFHNPPSYKNTVNLSWKPATAAVTAANKPGATEIEPVPPKSTKRPITFDDDSKSYKKTSKSDRELYQPPSGKYSTKMKNFQVPSGRGRAGRGRSFNYNRGRGRSWRAPY